MGKQRILIVAVNWLGDLLFMSPAIRAVRRACPDAHIACLVAPRGLDLLEGNPHLDEVIAWEEGRGPAGWLKIFPLAAGRTTFRQMGALLARTRLLVSNDSGPLHMGIAVGTPVVALFGPTKPELTGPPEGAKGVTLFGSIGCPVPCYQLHCPANLCMQQISVEQVLEAAGKFLS